MTIPCAPRRTQLVPPQRPVIPDAELCEYASGEPIRVTLAGPGKLDDLPSGQLGHVIARADGSWSRAHTASNALCMARMCSGSKAKLREAGLGIVELPACAVDPPPTIYIRYSSPHADV
jgi:hypothetical protein